MIKTLLEYSTQLKDFFWIVFTLVATITSILTYLQVKKSRCQSLYNKVIESQTDLYTKLLEILRESPEAFIFSCDFDLLLKYNLISHCVHFGCFDGEEIPEKIYFSYMAQMEEKQVDDSFELENVLRNIESITVYSSNEINHGEIHHNETKSSNLRKNDKEKIGMGIYKLTNIRGAFFHTPSFNVLYNQLRLCINNVYIPKKLSKRLSFLEKRLLDILLKKLTALIEREEERIFNAEYGEEIIIEFDPLFNELLGFCKELMKEHELVKKEIRKLLKIDASW